MVVVLLGSASGSAEPAALRASRSSRCSLTKAKSASATASRCKPLGGSPPARSAAGAGVAGEACCEPCAGLLGG
eukprot:11503233-Alexandrium_andersonii.AAC.1